MNAFRQAREPVRSVRLRDVLPERCFQTPPGAGQAFVEWMEEVGLPQLRKKGWTVLSWSGDEPEPFALCEIRGRRWRLVLA